MNLMHLLKLIQLFVLFLCVEAAPSSPHRGGHEHETGSPRSAPMCDCEESNQSQLEEKTLNLVNGQETFRISPNPFGSGQYGNVYHAFWPDYGICVALKEFSQTYPKTIIVMELGGMNFDNYFRTEILQGQDYNANYHEDILTDMLLCAARALGQFHKHGIHMDIKGINFVTIKGQEARGEMNLCKIIDFNSSFITDNGEIDVEKKAVISTGLYLPPEIRNQPDDHYITLTRKFDIYAYGVTIYKFMFSPRDELR
uniref:Protein kinase domain-containing protein n=1 Tax=Meloidogyne javanica TaxID=6303 RepID=A0A915N5E5_MELJA